MNLSYDGTRYHMCNAESTSTGVVQVTKGTLAFGPSGTWAGAAKAVATGGTLKLENNAVFGKETDMEVTGGTVALDYAGTMRMHLLSVGGEELALERHGTNFFESARQDAMTRVYESDRAQFLSVFSKENVIRELDARGKFSIVYRLVEAGAHIFVNMKITRMKDGNRVILGVNNIDAQVRQQEGEKQLRQERAALGRIAALSTNYIVLYAIDPATGHYTQYNPSREYEKLGLSSQGEDFFADAMRNASKAIYAEDIEKRLHALTKENVMREIQENGHFTLNYRLLINGKPVPVFLKAVLVEEDDGEKIILGVSSVG